MGEYKEDCFLRTVNAVVTLHFSFILMKRLMRLCSGLPGMGGALACCRTLCSANTALSFSPVLAVCLELSAFIFLHLSFR